MLALLRPEHALGGAPARVAIGWQQETNWFAWEKIREPGRL